MSILQPLYYAVPLMGNGKSKPEVEEVHAIENVRSTGFHVLEVHAPTAGMSVFAVAFLLFLGGALWIMYRRIKRSHRKQERAHGIYKGQRLPEVAELTARLDRLERMGERFMEQAEKAMWQRGEFGRFSEPSRSPEGDRALAPQPTVQQPAVQQPAVVVPVQQPTVHYVKQRRSSRRGRCDCGRNREFERREFDKGVEALLRDGPNFQGFKAKTSALDKVKRQMKRDADRKAAGLTSDWDTESSDGGGKKGGDGFTSFAFP